MTKNIKGKKTDVKDARWIQKLHSIGLLSGRFLPDETTETLRTYSRQRSNWIEQSVEATHKMQIPVDQKRKLGLIKKMKKQINKFEITSEEFGIVTE